MAVILEKLDSDIGCSISYQEDVDFPRFKSSRLEILSNGNFNDTCLLLSSSFFYLFSYLKRCSLKTK